MIVADMRLFRKRVDDLLQEHAGAAFLGLLNLWWGVLSSTSIPSSQKAMRSATSRAKPIPWVTQSMVVPVRVRAGVGVGEGPRCSLSRGGWRATGRGQYRPVLRAAMAS